MKNLLGVVARNWRKLVSTIFVLLVFTLPSSKGFFTKIFNQSAEAGQNNRLLDGDSTSSAKSVSNPSSQSTASPHTGTNSSTGGQSSRSRARHPVRRS